MYNDAVQPWLWQNPRQRRELQLRVRRSSRQSRSRWTGYAVRWSSVVGRSVSGNNPSGDWRPIWRCMAPTGHSSRYQIPTERLLQAELRTGDHQASERGIPRGCQQWRRRGRTTVLGVSIRSTGHQYLTEHRSSAEDQLEDDPLHTTWPRSRVKLSRRTTSRLHHERWRSDLFWRTEHRRARVVAWR